jgi:lipopolysaccharide/colanic/teichoic acid biosynthesis glycosyltransferase
MRNDQTSNSTVTILSDERVTPIGSILRRWKLDELLQLWNVLKENMSFVGLRPSMRMVLALFFPAMIE